MILLDTHIFIWLVSEPARIDVQTMTRLESDPIAISTITLWEVAMLESKGRIQLDEPAANWLKNAMQNNAILKFELSPEIAQLSCSLPGQFQSDPADRIIVATAIQHNLELATADQKILDYPHVRTIR